MRISRKTLVVGLSALGLTLTAAFTATAEQTGSQRRGGDAKSASAALKVGDKAPNFTLKDLNGKEHTLKTYTDDDKIVVLEWFNPGCPYVVKHHAGGQATMRDLAKNYKDKNVVWLAVNSTHAKHADYDKTRPMVKEWGITYPVLLDASGDVGKKYGAKTTPHMYIVDKEGVLRYAGAIDSHRAHRAPRGKETDTVTNYVKQALDEIIAGETVSQPETSPYGCGVKYPPTR